jgi:hypothetical protein
VKEYLETHPELFAELRTLILEKNLAASNAPPPNEIHEEEDDDEGLE